MLNILYHIGASLSCQVVELIGGDAIIYSLLDLGDDQVEIDELEVEAEGQVLHPPSHNGDIESLHSAIASTNSIF